MSTGTDFWTPGRFAAITQGRWLLPPDDGAAPLQGVTIDSRTVKSGEVFVAVKGENHDGHDHVKQAIERGAGLVIVSRMSAESGVWGAECKPSVAQAAILLVPDTVLALQQLASAWRDELGRAGVKVIAVTGSNGKTTTRHMIHAALSATLRGTQSPKSFNNHLGVPLTLLATPRDVDFVVAEVGTNHVGEIEALAKILRPDAAVITTIGTAHIGHFGSRDAIALEKSSLLRYIQAAGAGPSGPSSGLAVINGDQPYAEAWRREVIPPRAAVTTFGRNVTCDNGTLGEVRSDARGVHFQVASPRGPVPFTLPFLGEHNVTNALAAIAVARWAGVPDEAAARALSQTQGVEMRMQLVAIGEREAASGTGGAGGLTVINDAYNANPDSMIAALQALASLPPSDPAGRRVAILGDMFELGDEGPGEHARIGAMIASLNRDSRTIALTILVGQQMRAAAKELQCAGQGDALAYFEAWADDLPMRVAQLLRCGDLVLIKASRGMRFERLVPAMEERFAPVASGAARP